MAYCSQFFNFFPTILDFLTVAVYKTRFYISVTLLYTIFFANNNSIRKALNSLLWLNIHTKHKESGQSYIFVIKIWFQVDLWDIDLYKNHLYFTH